MAFFGDLLVRLKAETADFEQKLSRAASTSDRAFSRISKSANSMNRMLGTLGVGLSGAALVAFVKSGIDAADTLNKLSQKVGVSVESLSSYQYAAKLADLSNETLSTGFVRLARNAVDAQTGLGDAKDAFKALGLSVVDSSGHLKTTEKLMGELADKFAEIEDGAGKTAIATKILGRGGAEMIPFLNAGSAGLAQMKEEAERFGIVISSQTAKAAEDFNDNLTRLWTAVDRLKLEMASGLLPTMLEFTNQLLEVIPQVDNFAIAIQQVLTISAAGRTTEESLSNLNKELAEIQEKQKTFTGFALAPYYGIQESRVLKAIEIAEARLKREKRLRELADMHAGDAPGGGRRKAPAIAKPDTFTPQKELELYQRALGTLEKQYFSLLNAGQAVATQYETTQGSLRRLTPEHKKEVVAMAEKLDAYRRATEAAKQHGEIADKLIERERAIQAVLTDQHMAYSQVLQDMQFEQELVGKTAEQRERMIALRRIEIDVMRQMAALPEFDDEDVGAAAEHARAVNRIRSRAEEQKKAVLSNMEMQRKMERSFETGTAKAMDTYLDTVMNNAQQAEQFFTNSFRKMEDALVDFITTGKLDFRSLADSIIKDIARIYVQQQIMGPLIKALGMGGDVHGGGIFGPLLSAFGFGFGGNTSLAADTAIMSNFEAVAAGGAMASGTDFVQHDMIAKVHRGEAIIPAIENTKRGGDGDTFYIDARGADKEGLLRLERMIFQVNGSIERRAMGAVSNSRARRPR